jgi:hypothetical protein
MLVRIPGAMKPVVRSGFTCSTWEPCLASGAFRYLYAVEAQESFQICVPQWIAAQDVQVLVTCLGAMKPVVRFTRRSIWEPLLPLKGLGGIFMCCGGLRRL